MAFRNTDLAQSLIASFGGIVLFITLNTKFSAQIDKFNLLFLFAGILLILMSGKIAKALKIKNDRVQDVFVSIGIFGMFVGSKPYIVNLVGVGIWIGLIIGISLIIFANSIANILIKK